jgi:hypothetical protein
MGDWRRTEDDEHDVILICDSLGYDSTLCNRLGAYIYSVLPAISGIFIDILS